MLQLKQVNIVDASNISPVVLCSIVVAMTDLRVAEESKFWCSQPDK